MGLRRLLGAPAAFAVRLGGRGLALVLALVLVRVLGVEGYGIYAYATAWATVLIIPAALGFEQVLLRQVALYRSRGRPDLIRGIIRRAHETVLPLSLVLALVASVAAVIFVDPIFVAALLVVLPSIVLRSVSRIWSGVLQGLGRSELSFTPIFIVFPVTMLTAVGLLVLLGIEVTPVTAAAIYTAAVGAGLLFAFFTARHFLRPVIAGAGVKLEGRGASGLLAPFTAVAFLSALSAQMGLLMLGGFDEPTSVGILQVATRLAEPASMLLLAVNVAVAPKIARYFDRGDSGELQATTARAARVCFLVSVPIAAFLIGAQDWLLGIFGEGFSTGGTVLTIVALAQLFNAFTGPVNIALMMTNHYNSVMIASFAALVLNVVLCVVLIPSLGPTGAAIAMAADIVVSQSVLAVVAWRKLGLNTTALPIPFRLTGERT